MLTVFPVSFLATRTTKGILKLSFVDRYRVCALGCVHLSVL